MWEREMAVARQAAQDAGKALLELFGKNTVITKKGDIDLVTEADVRSEKILLDLISRHFPQDSILSEEAGEYRHRPERVWLLDPLDGTTNFAHQFPFFAVSIALEIEKQIALGVVFNPLCGECFHATLGGGAFLNETPISVSRTRTLQDSLLGTGFPYNIHHEPDRVLESFRKFLVRAQGVRRPGSAALDLCYVAAGRLDGFWEEGLKPWDSAAGVAIVKESGGTVTTYEGKPYSPYEKSIIASNPLIHGLVVQALGA